MDAAQPSLVASRLGLIAASGVLVGLIVWTLMPQQAVVVASMALSEGLVLVAWLVAAIGFGSGLLCVFSGTGILACVGRRPSEPMLESQAGMPVPLLNVITAIALGLGAMSFITLLLGVLGALHQSTAITLLAVGALLAIPHIYKHRAITSDWLRGSPGIAWLLLILAPVFAVMLIGTCVLPGLLWGIEDPSGYDVIAYHLQLPREWFDLGRITTLRHNVFSFFPLNVEMHSLLAMHIRGGPWDGMYLAQMMHGTFVALTIAAVYGFARERGRLAACTATIVCATIPWFFMLGSVAYVEGGLMLYATLAAAWAMRGRWTLAGACAGLACGCKLTGVPVVVVIAASVIVVRAFGSLSLWERVRVRADGTANPNTKISDTSSPHPSPLPGGEGAVSRRFTMVRDVALFAAIALLVFSPWLIRTAVASGGNPIFPLAMRTLGTGHFDAGQVERFETAHSPIASQQSIGGRLGALWQQVGHDYHFGGNAAPLWMALLVAALYFARRDRDAWIWLLILLGNVAVWLLTTHLQGRFLTQAIPFAALLVSCGFRVDAGRRNCIFGTVAIAIAITTLVAGSRGPMTRLFGPKGVATFVGTDISEPFHMLLRDETQRRAVYETDKPIVLVGDAKAFWYAIPSSRLHYRSVFDVGSEESFRDAWIGKDVPGDALVLIDPNEIQRFGDTYKKLPPLPESWTPLIGQPPVKVDELPK